jgi:hypothetical protein
MVAPDCEVFKLAADLRDSPLLAQLLKDLTFLC